jgi:hypothetical protein
VVARVARLGWKVGDVPHIDATDRGQLLLPAGGFDLREAKSLGRDEGSSQAVMRVVDASNNAITLAQIGRPPPLELHQATATTPIPVRKSRFLANG